LIRSMTGFGDAVEQVNGVSYTVDIRSLNNRYFKATLRLPESVSGLEAEIETLLRKKLNRGSITLTLGRRTADAQAVHRVNDEALLNYVKHLETIHRKVSGTSSDHNVNIDLTALLALPGVLQPTEDQAELLQQARPVVMRLVEKAADRLLAMRITEGQALDEDLARQRQLIRERLTLIAQRVPAVVEEYHQRLRARIDELLSRAQLKITEPDLIREVAIFAERSDISEEVSRLSGHLEQFEQIIAADKGEPAGRTLDFLAQEMLREANTIASKSNDVQIARAIVDVKGAIDRIKEQVQNVE
jgi:uncharacterized protein (TIGR00255 family)